MGLGQRLTTSGEQGDIRRRVRALGLPRQAGLRRGDIARCAALLPYGALLLIWAYLRLPPTLASAPLDTADTPSYRLVAARPWHSLSFLVGIRPLTVPLLYKLAGSDAGIVAAQSLIALLCWGLLAASVARAMRLRWLRLVAFAGVLAFSLGGPIVRWDAMLLSESLSLSLLALFVACWLWLLRGWSRQKAALLLGVAFFWACTRDTNAYILAMCAAAIVAVVLVRRRHIRRHFRYLGVAAILLTIFVAASGAADLSGRWVFPLLNVLMGRMLPDPDYTASLAAGGMPVTPALLRFAGKRAYSDDFAVYSDPALEDFRDWLFTHGQRGYLRFLFTHPALAFGAPFAERASMLDPNLAPNNEPDLTTPPQRLVGAVIYTPGLVGLYAWLAAAAVAAVGATWRARALAGAPWLVPLALLLFACPLGLIAWHGDTMDIGRHALQVSVQLRLGAWLLLVLALDALVAAAPGYRCPPRPSWRGVAPV